MWANRIYPLWVLRLVAVALATVGLSIFGCMVIIYGMQYRIPVLCIAAFVFNAMLIGATCLLSSSMSAKRRSLKQKTDSELTHMTRLALAGQISASIVHEITPPISAVLLNVEALEFWFSTKNGSPAIAENILSDLKRDQVRMREMVFKLRNFFSRRELRFEPIDMNELVTSAIQFMRPDINRCNVTVDVKLAPERLSVVVDCVHFQQVLITLVVNAIEAMDKTPINSRLLQISTHWVGRHSVEVVVSDSGPEMTQEQFEHAFEPFFTTKENSMGLGLSVAQSIVLAHRGFIWIERRAKGKSFHLEIPVIQTH